MTMPSRTSEMNAAPIAQLFNVAVLFYAAHDVTLSELSVELMYAGNEAADQFFAVPHQSANALNRRSNKRS
jgi:hypothetical protein